MLIGILYFSDFEWYLLLTTTYVWFFLEFIQLFIIPSVRRRKAIKKERKSTIILILGIALNVFFIEFLAFYTYYSGIGYLGNTLYIGLGLVILGIIIRQYSIYILGKYFSPHVEIQKEHKLIEKGLYKYIRHPSYLGSILSLTGLSIAFESLLSLIFSLILSSIFYGYRINVEEKELIKIFGNGYLNYIKRTKKLIPFLI
jgi:protein-S-isoprenylcysteine O-methyltransferase Ste14